VVSNHHHLHLPRRPSERGDRRNAEERGGGGGELGNLPTCCSHLPGSALIGRGQIHFFRVFLSSEEASQKEHSSGTLMRRRRRSLPFSAELIHAKQTGAVPSATSLGLPFVLLPCVSMAETNSSTMRLSQRFSGHLLFSERDYLH
jgi:hypothetical protein